MRFLYFIGTVCIFKVAGEIMTLGEKLKSIRKLNKLNQNEFSILM